MINTPHRTPLEEIWMELIDRKRLARLMLIQGVSQRELARAAGWRSHSHLGRLMRGDVKALETEPALRIAHALQVGVDDLFMVKSSSISPQNAKRSTRRVA